MSGILQTMFGGRRLVTQSFYSPTSFTVPPGVTSLKQVQGKGSNATSDYWAVPDLAGFTFGTLVNTSGYAAFNGVTFDQVNAIADNAYTDLSVGNGTQRQVTWTQVGRLNALYFGNGATGAPTHQEGTVLNTSSYTYTVRGTISGLQYVNSSRVTGSITWEKLAAVGATAIGAYKIRPAGDFAVRWEVGANGGATTAFGLTFPGGSYNSSTGYGSPASTTTYSNVAVTPGSSYYIDIPESPGYVTITYEV